MNYTQFTAITEKLIKDLVKTNCLTKRERAERAWGVYLLWFSCDDEFNFEHSTTDSDRLFRLISELLPHPPQGERNEQ